jgi:hypothetical protein
MLCGLQEGLLHQWRQEVLLLQGLHPGASTITVCIANSSTTNSSTSDDEARRSTTNSTTTTGYEHLLRQVGVLQSVQRLLQPLQHAQRRANSAGLPEDLLYGLCKVPPNMQGSVLKDVPKVWNQILQT